MSRKLNTEIVREEVESYGYKLIGEYVQKEQITIECKNGHIESVWVHRLKRLNGCKKCKFIGYQNNIRKEIEDQGYTLHNEYENIETVLEMTCPNGHHRECQIGSFRRYPCGKCVDDESLKNLLEQIIDNGYTIIKKPNDARGILEAICTNGHYRKAKIHNFLIHNCPKCNDHRNYDYTFEEVKNAFEEKGFELLSTEYVNCKTPLTYVCTCGEISETTFDSVVNSDKYCCDKCKWDHISEQMRGENHPFWNGGASTVSAYVRNNIKDWKKESIRKNDYRCIITQEKFDDLHHLYSFNYIFDEIKNNLPFPYKSEILDYTEDELKELRKISLEIHRKYGYGICLKSEIHNHFHSIYGRGYNDSFQFLTFVEDFYPEAYERVESFILKNCLK